LHILIADMKSSTSAQVEHRLQVAFYHAMLTQTLAEAGVAHEPIALAVLYRGPGGDAEPAREEDPAERERRETERAQAAERFGVADAYLELVADPDPYLGAVADLVTGPDSAARRAADAPFGDIPFHLTYKCDGCLYNEYCLKRAAEDDDLSLLPHLTQQDKGALQRAGVATTRQLAALKAFRDDTGPDLVTPAGNEPLVRQLGATWPVGPRLDELIHRAKAYRRYAKDPGRALAYIPSKGYGSLPYVAADQNPNLVYVYLDAQHDYLQDRLYLLGARVVACDGGVPVRERAVVRLADGPPEDAAHEGLLLVDWIAETVRAVVELAAPDDAGRPNAPVHLVFWDESTQRRLLEGLSRHFADVLGATPLYDFLTQLAAFDSPVGTFLEREIRETRNYPMIGQSLQAVASLQKFDWNAPEPYRDTFRARLFDARARFDRGDDETPWITARARFNSQIPLEYAYAAWGDLDDPAAGGGDDYRYYRGATPELLIGFQARRLQALEHVAASFRGNHQTTKTPFALPDLATWAGQARTLAGALDEFVTLERHAELAEWKAARLAPPERRILAGETLIVRYHEADQEPGVAAQNRENERRRRRREEYEAAYCAANPDAEKAQLTKAQKDETKWAQEGLRVWLRLDLADVECGLDEALALSTIRAGGSLVLASRWSVDSRLPEAERTPYTPTPKQLLYATRCALTELVVERDGAGRAVAAKALVELRGARGGSWSRGFVFGGFERPLLPDEGYTLDEDPNSWYGYWGAKVTEGLRAGGANTLYARLTAPDTAFVSWSDEAAAGQARFLAGLDALRAAGRFHEFEPGKRDYIGAHGADPLLLVQGPPGTGKSYSTAFALLARLQGALAADRDYRVFLSCKTHAATDVLLANVAAAQATLRALFAAAPRLCAEYFDRRLLDVPLFRIRPREAPPVGVTALWGKDDPERDPAQARLADAVQAARWCVVASPPGRTYGLIKERWPNGLFGHQFCDCLVLDEASQMNLPEACMAALPLRADGQLIVVGDHRQMPPIVKHAWDGEPRRTFKAFRAYESLFAWLLALDVPMIQFAESFRLHADMAEFLRREIYAQDGIAYHSHRRATLPAFPHDDPFVAAVLAPDYPLVVVVHDEATSQQRNPFERDLIAPALEALADRATYALGAEHGLGVVVPHRAQRADLRERIPALSIIDPTTGAITRSAVDTVERFQGDERDAILVSATESDHEYLLTSGDFLLDPRRLTVALSRAKEKMVLVASRVVFELFSADEETFANAQLWKNLLRHTCTVPLWTGERDGHGVTVWGNASRSRVVSGRVDAMPDSYPATATDLLTEYMAITEQTAEKGYASDSAQTGSGIMAPRIASDVVAGNLVTRQEEANPRIGRVESVHGLQASVAYFSSTGEGSTEACALGDLTRFRYATNAMIFSRTENAYGIVRKIRETDGLATYDVQFGMRRKRIPEADILPVAPASDPFELLRDGELHDAAAFCLAIQARRLQYAYSYDELVSLSNARIELLPHQVFVAHRILTAYPRSFLLADEVGLGKTIEAGLVIKELRARGAAKRVLVVAPAGLVPQWVDELQKKFNERFIRLDSATLSAHVAMYGAEAVWETHDNVVTSLHLLRSNEAHVEALARQHWDLVIFDEAHHLRRYLNDGPREEGRSTTGAYRLAERLTASATTTLLLTATPLQLHAYELYSLIELLDPTLFPSFTEFERYRRQIPTLNGLVQRLRRYETLLPDERAILAENIAAVLEEARNSAAYTPDSVHRDLACGEEERARYMEALGDTHRLTAVMLRNRKRLVFDDLQPRQARVLTVSFSQVERTAYDAVTAYIEDAFNLARATGNEALGFVMTTYRKILTSSSYALRQSFERRIARLLALRNAHKLLARRSAGEALDEIEEEELDAALDRLTVDAVADVSPEGLATEVAHLRGLCHLLGEITIDAKAARLLHELRQLLALPTGKVLIFTQFKQTLLFLQGLLQPHYRVAAFYGGLDSAEKDAIVDRFRDPAGAQILIATEAAGEGRNLQFCHIMFNYDLPWNPMKIEQRIGRLDRIGQEHPVEIYNFAIEDTLEDRVLQVLHDRIQIFESTVGDLDPIIGNLEQHVRNILLSPGRNAEAQFQTFATTIAQRVHEVREMEAKLTDFILDSRSFRRDHADMLLGREPAFTGDDLRDFVRQFLGYAGGQMREHAAGIYELSPPRGLTPLGDKELRDSYRATFDAALAQRQERLDFIAFGHELLDRAVAHCLDDAFEGKSAAITVETDAAPAGDAFCAVYEYSFDGIRRTKELRSFAVAPDGTPLHALAECFLTLAARALPTTPPVVFDDNTVIEEAFDVLEDAANAALEHARRRQNERNLEDYVQERQKLRRFFDAKEESAQREVRRLDEQLQQQRASADANMQRIVPATLGRLVAAQRHAEGLSRDRQQRLSDLDRRQTVTASAQLIAAAFVTIRTPTAGIHEED
jgi:SNF2 family DNA or RNA helicase